MYAGSPRVLASLWDVRDAATASLMTQFYRGVLSLGLSPAAALRRAQIEMWRSGTYEAPFYWAGFVLQGEWR
jgi:CHAT domain-containing protein